MVGDAGLRAAHGIGRVAGESRDGLDRVAGIYDLYTVPMEALGGRQARQRLLARATGEVLELGIGTGLPHMFRHGLAQRVYETAGVKVAQEILGNRHVSTTAEPGTGARVRPLRDRAGQDTAPQRRRCSDTPHWTR